MIAAAAEIEEDVFFVEADDAGVDARLGGELRRASAASVELSINSSTESPARAASSSCFKLGRQLARMFGGG